MKTQLETLLSRCALKSCNRCYGTGRTGFRKGHPLNCKCVTRDLKQLAPTLTVGLLPKTKSGAIMLLSAILDARENPNTEEGLSK